MCPPPLCMLSELPRWKHSLLFLSLHYFIEGYLRHLRQRRRLHKAQLIQHLHKTCLLHRIGLLLPILPLLHLPVLDYAEEMDPPQLFS